MQESLAGSKFDASNVGFGTKQWFAERTLLKFRFFGLQGCANVRGHNAPLQPLESCRSCLRSQERLSSCSSNPPGSHSSLCDTKQLTRATRAVEKEGFTQQRPLMCVCAMPFEGVFTHGQCRWAEFAKICQLCRVSVTNTEGGSIGRDSQLSSTQPCCQRHPATFQRRLATL